jgi:GT2 family glycosyltransferase
MSATPGTQRSATTGTVAGAVAAPGTGGHGQTLPATSLILSTRNRPGFVSAIVTAVLASGDVPTELVVVDQSDVPHPELATPTSSGGCEIRYIWSGERGLSSSRNAGIAVARHQVLVFLDDDLIVPSTWFGTIVRALVGAGSRAMVMGQVLAGEAEAPGGFAPSTIADPEPRVYRGRVGQDVLSSNMAGWRSMFEEVGGFDPRLGVGTHFPSSEDNDFGFRVLEAGYRIVYDPGAVLVHRAWRAPGAWIPLRWAYGRGQGAYFAKHMSLRDRYMLRRFWHDWTRHARRAPRRFLREPRLAIGDVVYAVAVLLGAAEWLLTQRWRG